MFYNDFTCAKDVFSAYTVAPEDQKGIHFLFADYTYEDYSGSSGVMFVRDGKFFVVSGSHCSCFGLEGQFEPEEITLAEIQHYRDRNAAPCNIDVQAFARICGALESMGLNQFPDDQIAMVVKLAF